MKRPFKQHRPLFSKPPVPKAGRRDWVSKIAQGFWAGLKRLAMVIGLVLMFNAVLVFLIVPLVAPKSSAPSLPKEIVLFLEFEGSLVDVPPAASFADPFAEESLTVREVVDALDAAAGDKRVKGVLARMRAGNFSMTQVAEIRAALKRFRAAGKFAHIYSSSYGDGGGLGRYYLASAFDEIWMQPLGIVSISGVHAEMPFLRGALDKAGITPQFYQRKEYKTAYENITNRSISKENEEMVQRLINDIRFEILETIPAERGMSLSEFETLVNKGLFTAEEALEAGLITHMDYGDVLLDNVAEVLTGERDYEKVNLVNMRDYADIGLAHSGDSLMGFGKPKVALVYAVGAIMPSGGSAPPGLGGGAVAAADKIAPAIFDAARDDDIGAIVLRIDSPGGSPEASESILRSIEKAREAGKPVIVSMGSTAASGGYWIAAYADRIFALPTTLTGSIGVVGGKFSFGDLAKKIGVNFEEISWGKNSGMWSMASPFDASEAERVNAMLDNVYKNFVARVAKGRKMSEADVDAVAGGRVWTGRRALEKGLVDEMGGLDEALDYAAVTLGGESQNDVSVVVLPKPKTSLERFIALLEGQVSFQNQIKDIVAPISNVLNVQQNPQHYMTYENLRVD